MNFENDEKILALAEAYRVLVLALLESGALDPAAFEKHAMFATSRLEPTAGIGASSALAELLEPLTSDVRRFVIQRGGGA